MNTTTMNTNTTTTMNTTTMKTKETTISGLRINFIKQCDECGRVFDLLKPTDAEEWECGHDCEPLADLILKIGSLTEENDHTGAVCALAVFAGSKDEVDEAAQIAKMHEEIGHMPMSLLMRRNSLRDRIMVKVAASHGRSNAMAIWDSF